MYGLSPLILLYFYRFMNCNDLNYHDGNLLHKQINIGYRCPVSQSTLKGFDCCNCVGLQDHVS